MAIAPNTTFVSGAILTAAQMNALPWGITALATSTTTYTLTTTETIATGMTLSFTAVANRYYRITYFEPQAQTSSVASTTTITIRTTDASGTVINNTIIGNESSADTSGMICVKATTLTAGTVTLVGCAKCSSVFGAPTLIRDATRFAQLMVEDMGPA